MFKCWLVTAAEAAEFQRFHSEAYVKQFDQVQPLPGERELLQFLTEAEVPWAIATSGRPLSLVRAWMRSEFLPAYL